MKLHFCYELNQTQKKEWGWFWNECQHSHPRQHYSLGEIERAKGRIPIYAAGEINGNLVCIAIFSIRPLFLGERFFPEAICLRGPAFDNVSFFKDFIQLTIARFKSLGVGSVRISPYWQFPDAEEVESALNELEFIPYDKRGYSRYHTGLVDLRDSPDQILASFSQKARYQIRKAERLAISIRPANTIKEARQLFDCLRVMQRQRGIPPMSWQEFYATFELIQQNQNLGVLVNAYHGETFLAGEMILRGPWVAHGFAYAIDRRALQKMRNITIGMSLFWWEFKWAKQKGCSWSDLEGYYNNIDGSSSLYHIHEHKRRFNPIQVQIIGQHYYVCKPLIYGVHRGCRFFFKGIKFAKSLPYQLKTRLFFRKSSGNLKPKSLPSS